MLLENIKVIVFVVVALSKTSFWKKRYSYATANQGIHK